MSWIDMVFVIIFFAGFWQGMTQGIVGTIAGVFFIIFGFLLAVKLTPGTTALLKNALDVRNEGMVLMAFILNVGLLWLGLNVIKSGLNQILSTLRLSFLNRALGGMAAALFSIVLYGAVIWFLDSVRIVSDEQKRASFTYPILEGMPGKVKKYGGSIWPYVVETWETSLALINQIDSARPAVSGSKPEEQEGNPARIYRIPDKSKDDGVEDDPNAGRRRYNGIEQ